VRELVGTDWGRFLRTCVRARGWLALFVVSFGCGRVGLDLLPLEDGGNVVEADSGDAGTPLEDASADAWTELMNMCSGSSCTAPGCPDDDSKTEPGICGCGRSDTADADGDRVIDCLDFCPGTPDRLESGDCACEAANRDQDGDGAANCDELCPFDGQKKSPGMCGCGAAETDGDADGTPDCIDACPSDPDKQGAGSCGCGVAESDTDLDGIADCVDRCSTTNESSYAPDATCGVGYCRQNNEPSSCVAGKETSCQAAPLLSSMDSTCDGVDDDCDGATDEDFASAPTTCGVGACLRQGAAGGMRTCMGGVVRDSCVPGMPAASDIVCDSIDEDCDGAVDEDVPTMVTTCSTGACAANGVRACVGGAMVDSCTASMTPAANDASCNNRDDDCNGAVDEDYVPVTASCGLGVCRRTTTTSCASGSVNNACVPGTRTSASDTSCNGLDDDCDGMVDEDYVVSATSCGVGACRSTGSLTCSGGATRNSCVAKAPSSSTDDAFTPGNGIDDDCDGQVDEQVPACNTTPRTFEPGSYNVAVPGNCKSVSVRLWGGGGASGQTVGVTDEPGGAGGPGGYATASALVTGQIVLYVGNGGASGCNNAGTNPGSASFNGGSGGTGAGMDGSDITANGGGAGGSPNQGGSGGRGRFGGGGGGQGNGGLGQSGTGGGGGAASVFIVNGVRAAIAGGGGGGGGAQATSRLGTIASSGGAGGSGCGAAGQVASSTGGGGGGGGLCQGSSVQTGSGTSPASSGSIPSGRARGASGDCGAGGAGYAIVTFVP
jgi:hypothetical protein